MLLNKFSAILLLVSISTYVNSQEVTSKIACEFTLMRLECNGNERLNIIGGNYGRRAASVCKRESNNNCINTSTLRILKQRCDGHQTCAISASNNVFGDPCPGIEKYLEVIYKCIPEVSCKSDEFKCDDGKCVSNTRVCDGWNDCSGGEDESKCRYRTAIDCNYEATSKIACEFTSMRLECNGNERLNIIGGNYGRRAASVCKRESNNNCINTSTLRILKQKCEGHQTCAISASNDLFGDPCPEVSCKSGELKCVDGKCVSNSRVCDGWKDCSGGDDEINCRYLTAYGCSYGGLNVQCNDGELIRVMKGNFGRNSSVICQQSPHSTCYSHSAFNILKQRCDLMRSCSVPVSTDIFGDPCPNIQDKYIEMQYACWTIPLHF